MSKKYNTKKKNLLTDYLKTDLKDLKKEVLKYSNVDSDWLEKEERKTHDQKNQDLLKFSFLGDKRRVSLALSHENGANINYLDKNGNNALILAVYSRREEVVKYLANYNKDEKGNIIESSEKIDINKLNFDGVSALHLAVKFKNYKIVKILLDSGANVNILNKYSESPIFEAVRQNDFNMIDLLKSYGADLNIRNKEGATALMVACQNKYRQESLIKLIKYGCNIMLTDNKGRNSLMYAANNDNGVMMDILIKEAKSNLIDFIDHQDLNGVTTLMICSKRGYREAVRVLLSKGANVFLKDKKGNDSLNYAKKYNNKTCYEIINKVKKFYTALEKIDFKHEIERKNYVFNFLQDIGKQNRIQNSCIK